MGRKSNISIAGVIVALGVYAFDQFVVNNHDTGKTNYATKEVVSQKDVQYGQLNDQHPDESLASSVLTPTVTAQLAAKSIRFNQAGAFILDDSKTKLNAKVSSAPYVQLADNDSLGRPGVANALLNNSTRQYRSRTETGNDRTIEPIGWHQLMTNGNAGALYNRGHSIGYALAGNLQGFDASEANRQNISTQTAWANQSSNGNADNTGQNYYETLVRQALDKHETVRYRVTPIYDNKDLVPAGSHIEAKSSDGKLEFNVFVPNVQPGVVINYETGYAKVAN